MFGEPFVPPVSDGSGQDRALLRKAAQLLQRGGLSRSRTASASTPKGEPLTVEFLLDEPTFQPHHMPYIKNLGTLGIDATLRIVDPVQYRKRVDDFDFDITVQRFSFSIDAGRLAAHLFLLAGRRDQGLAESRRHRRSGDRCAGRQDHRAPRRGHELITACQALDRVIRAGRYWVPHWYKASHWIAYWDVFGRPPAKPRYARGIPETWWYDRRQGARSLSGASDATQHESPRDAITMAAYIIRRILFMIPTLLGIMLVSFVVVQFAPGGPVERVIAQISGSDTGATSRISGSQGGDFGARGQAQGGSAASTPSNSKYRGAQGLDPEFIKSLEKQFGFDKPALRALLPDAVELRARSISARAISATSACCSSSRRSCRSRCRSASG